MVWSFLLFQVITVLVLVLKNICKTEIFLNKTKLVHKTTTYV